MLMAEEQTHTDLPAPEQPHKGCSISLMFPVTSDEEALVVKRAIDAVIPDVKGRRYTFQIAEM